MQKRFLPILSIMMLSCEFDDTVATYEDKLVVFCNLSAKLPLGTSGDTCYISISSAIEDKVNLEDLYIENAEVTITRSSTNKVYSVLPVPNRRGRYLTADSIIFQPGETYVLNAAYGEFEVSAETTIPGGMDYYSPDDETYNCKGEELNVPSVNKWNPYVFVLGKNITNHSPCGAINVLITTDYIYKNAIFEESHHSADECVNNLMTEIYSRYDSNFVFVRISTVFDEVCDNFAHFQGGKRVTRKYRSKSKRKNRITWS